MPGNKINSNKHSDAQIVDDTQGHSSHNNGKENVSMHMQAGNATQYLDLGQNKNYKTSTIINRWETARSNWLKINAQNKTVPDPKDGLPTKNIPSDHK